MAVGMAMSSQLNMFAWLWKAGLFLSPAQAMMTGIVLGGALASGYLLARTHARNRTTLIVATVLWALGVLVAYAGLAFAGCQIIMTNLK